MDSRRLIYLLMIAAVAIPVALNLSFTPARMVAAERMYKVMEEVQFKKDDVAMLWFDFGPNTISENQTQAEVMLEHLFRRRIPTIIISQYQQADVFMKKIPIAIAERLRGEYPSESWTYGKDWINVGFKPSSALFIQSLASSSDISTFLGKDVNGTVVSQFENFAHIDGLEKIRLVGEITGLMGVFDNIIQYFQKNGYRPTVVHGCTSITIPEAYIFLDSGQLNGLLEGIAGAAWYSGLLKEAYPARKNDTTLVRNTALGVAHVVILALIVLGNVMMLIRKSGEQHA